MSENEKKLFNILKKYNFDQEEKNKLLDIIYPIFNHEEFQRRMTIEFLHHGDITLGEHIIEDAVLTYVLSKKYEKKNKKINIILAVRIAMLHDLYTLPWQNNEKAKTKKFFTKHGFRHPIEAAINAINWYPELFKDPEEAQILIDGIVHHMYPLPVISFKNSYENTIELKNFELLESISLEYKLMLIKSSNRAKIGNISISRSLYIEGRIMAQADKKVSMRQIKNFSSATALVTGHNRSLKK